ncbi:hypothetical protein [Pseudomonas sp. C11]|uniref:hypothetical protein n=1 Tax=Pseudomonas sp. C11 TaxID=3075550 RepID=UPI002AFE4B87|nr:hypothetical protein [Pseudomonas sp. C11]
MSYDSTTSFLQGIAQDALTQAGNNASRIYSLPPAMALRSPNFSVSLSKPNIGKPPVFADLFVGGDSTDPTLQYMNEQSDAFIAKYFPQLSSGFKNMPEETLLGILSGTKPFGVDRTIFELVWHQARDRVQRAASSEQRTLEASFSARGFRMPPGQLIDAIGQSQQRATDAIHDVSRDQAIKDADIKQRMLEIGLQLATQMKTAIMASLADFYRVWVTLPDKDIERARIKAQAMSSLYGALSSYYNVEISFEELRLRAAQLKAGVDIDVDRSRISQQQLYTSVAGALASAVNAFADTAGSASQAGGSLTAQIENV